MKWEDGWPVIGNSGEPVLRHPLPTGEQREPERSDAFEGPELAPIWHWQANPRPDWYDAPKDGSLRLAVLPDDDGNLRNLPQVLGQQLPGHPRRFETSVRLDGGGPGTRAGLVVLGQSYAWIGLHLTPTGVDVVLRERGTPDEDVLHQAPLEAPYVELAADVDENAVVRFSYRVGGEWVEIATTFQAVEGRWIGAEVGLFAAAPQGTMDGGGAVFGPVRVTERETA
jgi:beta-xylosidase